ncbi:MAG: 2-oxoisovalerate dehydrogenase [Planctomycetes bacterium]|nr:2-oxoisovalerate dehydrogenase [Planctomycetota bacterium]
MREIVFQVEEDPVDGGFVAHAVGHGIVTQADTLDELRSMVIDAVRCHFDGQRERPTVVHLHFIHEETLNCP